MLRPAADHRVHQDYISDHLELTGERKEEEDVAKDRLYHHDAVGVKPCHYFLYLLIKGT